MHQLAIKNFYNSRMHGTDVKIIPDMFRTNNFSSSGGLYKQLTVFFHAFCEESNRCHDARCFIQGQDIGGCHCEVETRT